MPEEDFWSAMKGVRAGILATAGARFVPMSPHADEPAKAIWFISAQGTDLVDAAQSAAQATLILTGNGDFHARIGGTAEVVADREKLQELWNTVAASWFDGIEGPSIRLIRLVPKTTEVWDTPGAVGFLMQVAKANFTGAEPDLGDTYSLSF